MLLVLSRHVFTEKEAAQLCVTMRKHSSGMTSLTWYIKLLDRHDNADITFFALSALNANNKKTEA